jgi:hypothetical protein
VEWVYGAAPKSEREPPGAFSKEVNAFSVDRLSNGFTAGYSELAADRAALVQLGLTGARAKVDMATGCLAIPSTSSQNEIPCALFPR